MGGPTRSANPGVPVMALKAMKAMQAAKAMKATKGSKAMKASMKARKAMKAKVVSKIARGVFAKSAVLSGRKEKTSGGLRKADLTKNGQGKVVSRKMSARGKRAWASSKLKAWTDACKKARKALGLKGFVAVGGQTAAGSSKAGAPSSIEGPTCISHSCMVAGPSPVVRTWKMCTSFPPLPSIVHCTLAQFPWALSSGLFPLPLAPL